MHTSYLPRWLLPVSLSLLAACAQTPSTVSLDEEDMSGCPLSLHSGQDVLITLSSNPSTGFLWEIQDAAPGVLRSLGPGVYSNPEDAGLVGSAGLSTWQYKAQYPGNGRLLMVYRRSWEADVAPAKTFDCTINVQ
jgi:inhibitor of cysteine peptidase